MADLTVSDASRVINVAPWGDDGNDGGVRSPLRTLRAAAMAVPDIVRGGHTIDIRLGEGDFGAQSLVLDHSVVLGRLIVSASTPVTANHRLSFLRASSVQGRLEVYGLTATRKDGSGPSFWFQRCAPEVYVDRCFAEGAPAERSTTGVQGFLADYGTNLHVRRSGASHKRYAVRSNYLSRVFALDLYGEGNTFALGARWGGILSAYGTIPGADRPYSTDSAGVLIAGQGFSDLTAMGNPGD